MDMYFAGSSYYCERDDANDSGSEDRGEPCSAAAYVLDQDGRPTAVVNTSTSSDAYPGSSSAYSSSYVPSDVATAGSCSSVGALSDHDGASVSGGSSPPSKYSALMETQSRATAYSCAGYGVPLSSSSSSSCEDDDNDGPCSELPSPRSPASPSGTPYVRDWNGEFQALCAQPASEAKYTALGALGNDFLACATLYGRVIIREHAASVQDRVRPGVTIPVSNAGGIAGGAKFFVAGIFFKFARDTKIGPKLWMYGGSEGCDHGLAAKAAGLEIKHMNTLHHWSQTMAHSGQRSFSSILMCSLDLDGYRLLCIAKLPVNGETLVQGSCDGGKSVHNSDAEADAVMQRLSTHLHVVPHFVGSTRVCLAGDVEVHRGLDGRIYVLDVARLTPPDRTPSLHQPRSVFYRLLRTEMVAQSPTPLNPDAFSGWHVGRALTRQHNAAVTQAAAVLEQQVLPRVAASIAELSLPTLSDVSRGEGVPKKLLTPFLDVCAKVVQLMHAEGLNVRHLGLLLQRLGEHSAWQRILLSEMVARVLKIRTRAALRAVDSPGSGTSDATERRRDLIVAHAQCILGLPRAAAKQLWCHDVRALLVQSFGTCMQHMYEPGEDVSTHVNMVQVWHRWSHSMGLSWAPHLLPSLAERSAHVLSRKLPFTVPGVARTVWDVVTRADLLDVSVRVKSLNVVEYASAKGAHLQCIALMCERHARPKEAMQLAHMAVRLMTKAMAPCPSQPGLLAERARIFLDRCALSLKEEDRVAAMQDATRSLHHQSDNVLALICAGESCMYRTGFEWKRRNDGRQYFRKAVVAQCEEAHAILSQRYVQLQQYIAAYRAHKALFPSLSLPDMAWIICLEMARSMLYACEYQAEHGATVGRKVGLMGRVRLEALSKVFHCLAAVMSLSTNLSWTCAAHVEAQGDELVPDRGPSFQDAVRSLYEEAHAVVRQILSEKVPDGDQWVDSLALLSRDFRISHQVALLLSLDLPNHQATFHRLHDRLAKELLVFDLDSNLRGYEHATFVRNIAPALANVRSLRLGYIHKEVALAQSSMEFPKYCQRVIKLRLDRATLLQVGQLLVGLPCLRHFSLALDRAASREVWSDADPCTGDAATTAAEASDDQDAEPTFAFPRASTQLVHLDVSCNTTWDDVIVTHAVPALLLSMPTLTSLHLEGTTWYSMSTVMESSLMTLAPNLTQLKGLRITEHQTLDYIRFLEACTRLQSLTVRGLTAELFKFAMQPSVTSLHVKNMPSGDYKELVGLWAEHLSQRPSDQDLHLHLEELILKDEDVLTVVQAIKGSPRSITMRQNNYITMIGFEALATFTTLTSLSLHDSRNIGLETLQPILRANAHVLQEIRVTCRRADVMEDVAAQQWMQDIGRMPNVAHVHMIMWNLTMAQTVQWVVEYAQCSQLQSLRLDSIRSVKPAHANAAIHRLLIEAPMLQTLGVRRCSFVTEEALSLLPQATQLQCLELTEISATEELLPLLWKSTHLRALVMQPLTLDGGTLEGLLQYHRPRLVWPSVDEWSQHVRFTSQFDSH